MRARAPRPPEWSLLTSCAHVHAHAQRRLLPAVLRRHGHAVPARQRRRVRRAYPRRRQVPVVDDWPSGRSIADRRVQPILQDGAVGGRPLGVRQSVVHSLRHLRPAAARRAQTAASATAAAADSMPSSATGSDSAPSCRASTAAATALTQVSQLRRDARALCSGAPAGRAVPSSPVRVATRAEQAAAAVAMSAAAAAVASVSDQRIDAQPFGPRCHRVACAGPRLLAAQ